MPVGNAELRIGTSGWNYPSGKGTWNGVFYPPSRGRAKTFDESPFWTPVTLLGRTYQGQDRDLLVPGAHSTLVANKQADPELIYQIVKTIVERNREFADLHPGGRDFTIAKTRMFVEQNLVPMAFHPGAERYWREKGVLK